MFLQNIERFQASLSRSENLVVIDGFPLRQQSNAAMTKSSNAHERNEAAPIGGHGTDLGGISVDLKRGSRQTCISVR